MTRVAVIVVVVAVAVTALAGDTQDAARAVEFYLAGMEALEKDDVEAYANNMREALAAAPGQPVLMRHYARALVRQGNEDEAVAWLEKVAATGVDLRVAEDEHFAPLRGRDDFQRILDEIAAARTPIGEPEVAMRLDLDDFMPEGIAYDPEGDMFYLGSVRQRRIIRISTTGHWEEFAAPDDMTGVLGLRVDAERRNLWALSAVAPGVTGYTDARNGDSSVHCFDLDGGGFVDARFHLPNTDGGHNLNDLVVAADGTVYITDSVDGGVYTIEPGGERLLEFIAPGQLRGPNGIALSTDGSLLYVSQYAWGIVAVDIARRSWEPMPHPPHTSPIGIDGLYLHDGALVGIQNYVGLQHVTRFELGAGGRAIVGSRILARHHPCFNEPTTGAFRGNDFYVIANSQLTRIDADGNVPPPDTFDDTFILRLAVE